jgi:hypothetical protein
MRVDPEVSHRKFDRELAKLNSNRTSLEKRGIFLLTESVYPVIQVYYAPRSPLRLLIPPAPGTNVPLGSMMLIALPSLAAAGFKVKFDLTDYDLQPPSLDFFDLATDRPLDYLTMFRALEFESQRGAHEVLLQAHPKTNRPFLCIRGVREYHEHPQHTGDDWLIYRDQTSLFSLVNAVWRVTIDLVRPQLVLPQTVGTINLQWTIPEAKQ